MNELGLNEVELRDGYDAVFHLVTAAKVQRNFIQLQIILLEQKLWMKRLH